ncbi:hypothetical protein ACI789_06920 [Geodermatophilus sp. SYSU D00965]
MTSKALLPVGAVAGLTAAAAVAGALGGRVPAVLLLVLAAAVDAVAVRAPAGGVAETVHRVLDRRLRLVVRLLVLVGLLAGTWPTAVLLAVVLAGAATLGLLSLVDGVDDAVQGLRRQVTGRLVPGLGGALPRRPGALLLPLVPEGALLITAGLLPDRPVVVWPVVVAAVAVAAGAVGAWVLRVRAVRRQRGARLAAVQRYLDDQRPEVVLYGGDAPESVHEVAMWLSTLERLPQRAVVLLRNRATMAALPATTTPVLCVPAATDLMALRLDPLRVALFVSNIGNNIHLLRVPGLRSTFIGHGDSDKSASANPYSKAYDEIWVAGPAGRDRYLRADVGVRADAIREVGRPQLDDVRPARPDRPAVPTLLYAPTWEGWNAEQDYCSLRTHGELLVRAVLAGPVPIRLVYRPHPYTGRRDRRVAAAHRRVVALLEEANAARGHGGPTVLAAEAVPTPAGGSARAAEAAAVVRGEERLAALPPQAHVVVGSRALPLASCFNAASGLVTDVSSVLSDFLAADKPFGTCDPRGRDAAEFVGLFPSAGGGLVLAPDGGGVEELLATITGTAPDRLRAARAEARGQLLGPADVPAIDRFAEAVSRLGGRTAATPGTPA